MTALYGVAQDALQLYPYDNNGRQRVGYMLYNNRPLPTVSWTQDLVVIIELSFQNELSTVTVDLTCNPVC